MSLYTRKEAILVGASAGFLAGTPEMLSEEVAISETGWDTLTQQWAVRRDSLTAEDLAAAYPVGSKLTGRNWWLVAAKPVQRFSGMHVFELGFKGWAAEKPVKIQWGSVVDQQSAENILGPSTLPDGSPGPDVTYARVQVNESAPGFTAQYLVSPVTSGTVPALSVGRTLVRAEAPPVPDTIWAFLERFVFHFPFGWVLMDLQADILAGTTAGLITEHYKYIRERTP